jgi:hypothetical protein
MAILTTIERKTFQVFKGKARAHSCPDLPPGDSSNKYGRRPWYADTRVERNGLSHRCLPYYQRWTHWASVKYVKKKKTCRVSLYIGVRITMIRCVVCLLRIFKMFHGLMNNPVYSVRYYPRFHITAVGLVPYYPWIRGHYSILDMWRPTG